MKLNDRVAIVTGGGRGIGREITLALSHEGADVVVCGRQLDVLEQTVTEIETQGRRALAIVTDVSNEVQVNELINKTLATFGRVDILVNNAGIAGPTAAVTNLSRAAWDEVMAVNLTSAFLCSRAVIPHMSERSSGKIVNISSVAGKMAYALRSPYAASKWGMIGLSASLAQELGAFNIQVNAICPGPTAGERMTSVIAGRAKELGRSADEVERLYLENTALKRMVDPKHVAAAVVFFCSEAGDSITGEALEVSSGYAL
ncbi:MAG TPA: SDR family oxidoreductase [Pyrinomonadaceae bacterium]|nr:SDR family oxidoreductase [Pyrinomonadaceae bacterium]